LARTILPRPRNINLNKKPLQIFLKEFVKLLKKIIAIKFSQIIAKKIDFCEKNYLQWLVSSIE